MYKAGVGAADPPILAVHLLFGGKYMLSSGKIPFKVLAEVPQLPKLEEVPYAYDNVCHYLSDQLYLNNKAYNSPSTMAGQFKLQKFTQ